MSVTGHKSLNSLAIYQKVSTDEKLSMAYAMSCYLQYEKNQQPAIQHHAQPTSTVSSASVENSNQACTIQIREPGVVTNIQSAVPQPLMENVQRSEKINNSI